MIGNHTLRRSPPHPNKRTNPPTLSRFLYFSHKHAFLLFSSSMEGRRALAAQTAEELQGECALDTVARTLGGSFVSYTAWPWLVAALRFGEFGQVLAETDDAAVDPDSLLPYTEAMRRFVRGYALAATGACAAAGEEAKALAALAANDTTRNEPLFLVTAGQMFDVAGAALRARLAAGGCLDGVQERGAWSLRGADNGDSDGSGRAVLEWARAAALVDAFPYMEPPMWPADARACLGQALLDAGRYAEAERVYEEDLKRWPGNGWSLKGLQVALEGQGRRAEAWVAERACAGAWRNADVELEGRSCF